MIAHVLDECLADDVPGADVLGVAGEVDHRHRYLVRGVTDGDALPEGIVQRVGSHMLDDRQLCVDDASGGRLLERGCDLASPVWVSRQDRHAGRKSTGGHRP